MNPDIARLLVESLSRFLSIYLILIFIRVLLSWFQTMDWAQQVMAFVSPLTDPYLNLFRSFIPPLGGIDFSPIIAIFALQIVGDVLIGGLARLLVSSYSAFNF